MSKPIRSVTVVIPCKNERLHINSLLEQIRSQRPHGLISRIVVADGMSDDGTRELLEAQAALDERLLIIDNPDEIVAAGLNRAIRAASTDIIVRMDAHADYASDYVKTCVDHLEKTGADNVGGPARTRHKTFLQYGVACCYGSPFSVGGARFHDSRYEGWLDTVTYGCWRKSAFERFGFFDESLVRNQDDEHNYRIRKLGGRVWQSSAIKSWYYPRSSLSNLYRQYYQYGYWKVAVIRKHRAISSWRHLIPGLFCTAVLSLALGSIFSQVLLFALALVGFSYAFVLACGAVAVAFVNRDVRLFPLVPVVLTIFHVGYGLGFLSAILDLLIKRDFRGAEKVRLTR